MPLRYKPRIIATRDPRDAIEGGTAARRLGWDRIVADLRMALEPVVGTHSGRTLGVEAVIGNAPELGFASGQDLLDCAHDDSDPDDPLRCDDRLADVEAAAHARAVALFAAVPDRAGLKLFLNLDMRLRGRAAAIIETVREHLDRHGIPPAAVVVEISERLAAFSTEDLCRTAPAADATRRALLDLFGTLRGLSGRLALGDFGAGYASLPLLTLARPDLVKLDRYFIQGAARERGRRLALNTLTNLAHLLGSQVVAEGVETADEYHVCRQAGCDYVQGPLAGGRVFAGAHLDRDHADIRALNEADQRRLDTDAALISAQTQALDAITLGSSMATVFERFRAEKDRTFFPVVDPSGEPVGIIRELDLKEYTYSLYGKELLSNRALGRTLDAFVARCPIADVNTQAEKILELFSASAGADCVLITRDRQYSGFLSAASLLKVINEKNLALARDQNPLSRLPGNTMINEYISRMLVDRSASYAIAYLDFDHFKPFNDAYGYRQGDRAITLFAELLRKMIPQADTFVGHVGGDDFFVGFRAYPRDQVVAQVSALVRRFQRDVESFYDETARQRRYIIARDRDGIERRLSLLTASAAIVELPQGHSARSVDEIAGLIAGLKRAAKAAPDKVAVACYAGPDTDPPDAKPETGTGTGDTAPA
ncbi:bifunctional diguanylate cyclase/phosphodiesterase [Roseospira goensis]|uniref:Diguanylate cyclase (GGDEF)-like protein n=1 Tax=Roseospira goensis TaxID=391922 RepID=A0A7W6WMF3_9PROT|nr:bifunctional diguanylate cyclase/phosphodiesterase [Roseospira goensis]MBB4287447.1 diguanylate cyclase (GGDEF)-like protein [Roseospira goensis]